MIGNSTLSLDNARSIPIKGRVKMVRKDCGSSCLAKKEILIWWMKTFWRNIRTSWNPDKRAHIPLTYIQRCYIKAVSSDQASRSRNLITATVGAVLIDKALGNLYFDPERPSAFSTLKRLQTAARQIKIGKKTRNQGIKKNWMLTHCTGPFARVFYANHME